MRNSIKQDIALALLRIVPSAMLLTHGIPKFQKLINGNFEFPDPIGIGSAPSLFLAVIGEVVCPILVIIGLKTRLASIPAAITMIVVIFVVHLNDPLAQKELAILYLVSFMAIFLSGPGKYSIDKK